MDYLPSHQNGPTPPNQAGKLPDTAPSGDQPSHTPSMMENGVLFRRGDESSYPPEFTFVVTNLSNEPVYYNRKDCTWWTAKADRFGGDIYGRDDYFHYIDDEDTQLYWQPISFKKADVLFIPIKSDDQLTSNVIERPDAD